MRARSGSEPRVARARLARLAALVLLALAALALAGAWAFGDRGLGWIEARAARTRVRLGNALKDGHGLAFYAPLDEPAPADAISGTPLSGTAAVRVPGAVGRARRFDGRAGENLVGPLRWSPLARNGFTLSLWARVPAAPETGESRLVWDRDGAGAVGLRLRGGALEAVFADASGTHVLSAPPPAPDRFAHLALSVGTERAALFVDGHRVADAPVSAPLALPAHTVAIGTDGHAPPSFDADEWCVWNRPLSSAEVARLGGSRRAATDLLEPRLAARARRHAARAAAFRGLLGALGAFHSTRASPAVLNRSVPALELRLSGADRRHFRAAHLQALSSGFRTREGARARGVQASFRGRSERILAWLDELVLTPPLSSRPAFVLASEDGLFGEGSGLVRLFPPEQFGARRPDATLPLPLEPSGLVRLHLDGDFLGLYCLAPFEGPAPPWFATGDRIPSRSDRLHFAAPAGDAAAGAGLSPDERSAAWRRMLSLLGSDPHFPLRPPEARLLAKRHGFERERLAIPDPTPGPEALLGANPAAFYVTNDLALAAAGPGLAWRSSDPATISPEGRVTRPGDGRPRVVELSADLPGGGVRAHRFRVMPTAPALPALLLSFGRPLDKLSRTDFVCLRIPAGEGAEPTRIAGTGPTGGGAKLRGNTSYVTGRRLSANLRFDEPVEFPGVAEPVRHVLLLSGYADPTRLRNALSFDVFRALSPEGTVRSVPIVWTELFVNGAYAGVCECCPRLQDALTEPFSALYKVRSSRGLWTDPDGTAENVDRVGATPEDEEDPYAPLRELARIVSRFGTGEPGSGGGEFESFDVDELLDFWILLNLSGNEDGRVTNQYVGRRAEDGRWILLPWDYDKTFLPGRVARLAAAGRAIELSSPLFSRLFQSDPTLRDRLAARWRDLRAGPLSDGALDAWIDERAALLAPYMDEDYRVVPPLGHDGDFADAIRVFRDEVRARAGWLDRFLAAP